MIFRVRHLVILLLAFSIILFGCSIAFTESPLFIIASATVLCFFILCFFEEIGYSNNVIYNTTR